MIARSRVLRRSGAAGLPGVLARGDPGTHRLGAERRAADAALDELDTESEQARAFARGRHAFGDDLAVLRNLHLSLAPGGVCVVDVMGKERLARIFQPTHAEELPDGSTLVQRHAIEDGWNRIRNRWDLLREDGVRSFNFSLNLYSGQELRERLLEAGFEAACAAIDAPDVSEDIMRRLRIGRRRAALVIAIADIADAWSVAEVTGALSRFLLVHIVTEHV